MLDLRYMSKLSRLNCFVVYPVSFQSKMSVIIYVKYWALLVSSNTLPHGIVFA